MGMDQSGSSFDYRLHPLLDADRGPVPNHTVNPHSPHFRDIMALRMAAKKSPAALASAKWHIDGT